MELITFESDAAWQARFNEYLQGNKRALDSLRSLVDEGIPQDWLLCLLYAYADPRSRQEEQLRQRRVALASLKEVDRIVKVLAATTCVLESLAGNGGVPEWVRDHHFNLRRNLSENLKGYKQSMIEVRRELSQLASAKGEGISEESLAGLVEGIRSVTGQAHWGDLAYLVEGTYFAHNRRLDADRDTIRKRYSRFVKNFPRIHESWTGKDWHSFFGLPVKAEDPVSANPQDQMDHFIRRFGPSSSKRKSSKPRYGKIHTAMKR